MAIYKHKSAGRPKGTTGIKKSVITENEKKTQFGGVRANQSTDKTGNDFKLKWKTPEERKHACIDFCLHIKSGLSKDCFPPASWQTIQSYIQDFPNDFIVADIEDAFRENQIFWESMGVRGSKGHTQEETEYHYSEMSDGEEGKIKKVVTKKQSFNAMAWKFNMMNRFKWGDNVKSDTTHTIKTDLNEEQKKLLEQFEDAKKEAEIINDENIIKEQEE